MDGSIGAEVGRALRRLRTANGFTLRAVAEASAGEFKASVVAGYERGERRISLQRFCDLARFYDAEPDALLGEILHGLEEAPEVIYDLTPSEQPEPSGT